MQGAHFQSHARSVNQCIQKAKLLINVPYSSILYFLHAHRRIQKVRGSRLMFPTHLSYAFYIRSVAYKKQGAPIDIPYSTLCFLHVQCRIQKARDS
jgi:hypothetical protein